jgi:ubiquinone/menaquinone biosynthesis C-methylase UbiE
MSFDSLAPHYRWMEWLSAGEKLQRCRVHFLDRIKKPETILIVGEGNGRFLCECRRAYPNAKITCADASSRMLELARVRLQRHGLDVNGIHFLHKDIAAWTPPANAFDLVVTHFFLDCFSGAGLRDIVLRLANSARPSGQWILADFQIPDDMLLKLRARAMLWLMYSFFRVVTRLPARELHKPDTFLETAGFVREAQWVSEWGLLRSDLWQKAESCSRRRQSAPQDSNLR